MLGRLAIILLLPWTLASAQTTACAESPYVIRAAAAADARAICQGAVAARRFLARQDIVSARRLRIDVVDRLTASDQVHALANYDPAHDRIEILSLHACREHPAGQTLFGEPLGPELYLSLAAHEMAHAIAADRFRVSPPARVAHEYLAYTTQLAVLPPALRARVLDRYRQPAFEGLSAMSETLLALDPAVFAVKAYRHFLARGDGGRLPPELFDMVRNGSP